jgi:hypothetical protein
MSGIFDLLFDDDYELHDFERAIAADVAGLGRQLETLQDKVRDLSMTVAMLMRVLAEQNQLDPKVVRYRVEAQLEDLQARYDELQKSRKAPTVAVTCSKCGASVPANQTTITADGQICDRCAG